MKTKVRRNLGHDGIAVGAMHEGGAVSRADEHNDQIATAAYFKAEGRGFAPGQELDDWLAAEAEFKQRQFP